MIGFYIGVIIGIVVMYIYYNYTPTKSEGFNASSLESENGWMKIYMNDINVRYDKRKNKIYYQYARLLSSITNNQEMIEIDENAVLDGLKKKQPVTIKLKEKNPLYLFAAMVDDSRHDFHDIYLDDDRPAKQITPFVKELKTTGKYTFNRSFNDLFGDPAYGLRKKLMIIAVYNKK